MPHFSISKPSLMILQKVDSTNNYAMACINDRDVSNGTAWLALHQTSGKGQRGHEWQSEPGENIIMSLALKPRGLFLSNQFMLSMAVALGSYDFVKKYAGTNTTIKWSNDIYIGDKKAGGILVENVIRGNKWIYAVAGIGLNLNQENFSPALPNPVSLSQVTGKKYDLIKMAEELQEYIMDRFAHLRPAAYEQLMHEYVSRLYHLGIKQQFLTKEGKVFEAVIKGVEQDGKLILEKGERLINVNFGEISFII